MVDFIVNLGFVALLVFALVALRRMWWVGRGHVEIAIWVILFSMAGANMLLVMGGLYTLPLLSILLIISAGLAAGLLPERGLPWSRGGQGQQMCQ